MCSMRSHSLSLSLIFWCVLFLSTLRLEFVVSKPRPAKYDFFQNCDPNDYARNYHENHTVIDLGPDGDLKPTALPETTPGPHTHAGHDEPPRSTTPVTGRPFPSPAPPPFVFTKRPTVSPQELETLANDIGNYDLPEDMCKDNFFIARIEFNNGSEPIDYTFTSIHEKNAGDLESVGIKDVGDTHLPEMVVKSVEFVSAVKSSLMKDRHWEPEAFSQAFGPLKDVPPIHVTVSPSSGVIFYRRTGFCNLVPKLGTGLGYWVHQYSFTLNSDVMYRPLPLFSDCVPELGWVPLINRRMSNYVFINSIAEPLDLKRDYEAGFTWVRGGPVMMTSGNIYGPFVDNHRNPVLMKIDAAYSKLVGLPPKEDGRSNLKFAMHMKTVHDTRVHIMPGTSARIYQRAAKCGDYRVLIAETVARRFRNDNKACLQEQALDSTTKGTLADCSVCPEVNQCDSPSHCKVGCSGLNTLFKPEDFKFD